MIKMESILFNPNSSYDHIREQVYRRLEFEDLLSVEQISTGARKCVKMFPNKFQYLLADGQLWKHNYVDIGCDMDDQKSPRPLLRSFDENSGRLDYRGPLIQDIKVNLSFDSESLALESDQELLHTKILRTLAPQVTHLYLQLTSKDIDPESSTSAKKHKTDSQPGPAHDICSLLPETFRRCAHLTLEIDKSIKYKFFCRIFSLFPALTEIYAVNCCPSLYFLPNPNKLIDLAQFYDDDYFTDDEIPIQVEDEEKIYDFSNLQSLKLAPGLKLAKQNFDPKIFVGLDWTSPRVKLSQLRFLQFYYDEPTKKVRKKVIEFLVELLHSIAIQCPKTFSWLKLTGNCPNLERDLGYDKEFFPTLLTQKFSSGVRLLLHDLSLKWTYSAHFRALLNLLAPGALKTLHVGFSVTNLENEIYGKINRQAAEIFQNVTSLKFRVGCEPSPYTDLEFMEQIVGLTRYMPRLARLKVYQKYIDIDGYEIDEIPETPSLTAVTPSLAETLVALLYKTARPLSDHLLEFLRGLKSLKTLGLSTQYEIKAKENLPANLWTYIQTIVSDRLKFGLDSLEEISYYDTSGRYSDSGRKEKLDILVAENFPPNKDDGKIESLPGFEWTVINDKQIKITFPPLKSKE